MQFKWDQAFGRVLFSAVAVLGLSTGLTAYDGTNMKNRQNTHNRGAALPNNYAFSYPKDLNLMNPYDVFFHAEFLLFQAKETGTEFVLDNEHPGTALAPALDGDVAGFSGKGGGWDYNPGFRVGTGLYLSHDAWGLDFTWTWLNITNSRDFEADASGVLIPLWALGENTPANDSGSAARGNWHCKMNVVDASLGKAYHVSRSVVFNPHFGLRFAWIDQHLSAHYRGFEIQSNPSNIYHGDNDFWGLGGRVGIDTEWTVISSFRFFANASTSILAGTVKTENEYLSNGQRDDAVEDTPVTLDLDHRFHMNLPNLELALGIDWGTHLYNDGYYLNFRVGYEFQVWWDQLNLRRFPNATSTGTVAGNNFTGNFYNDAVSRGMFTLNGFTIQVQLDL